MPKFRTPCALMAVMCLFLGACSAGTRSPESLNAPDAQQAGDSTPAEDKPLVLTTFTVLADMVRNVGGGHIRVESITRVGAEIHGYEPVPSDLKNAAQADLILDNGLGLERWFTRFVEAIDAPHAVLSAGVDPIPITVGEYQGEANPHAWMSPAAGQLYVDNIVAALSKLAPEHAEDFSANGDRYKQDLQQLLDDFRNRIETTANGTATTTPALVTCEGAFSYLARDAGLREAYLWPVNADSEGTPGQIVDLIEFIDEHQVSTVFCESTVNPSAQQQVAAATGAVLRTPLYVDSLSEPGGPVPSYVELLRHDIDMISESLAARPGGEQ